MDKRLLSFATGLRRWLVLNVAAQWFAMLANVAAVFSLGWVLARLQGATGGTGASGSVGAHELLVVAGVFVVALVVRFACGFVAARASHRVCCGVKAKMRDAVYGKLLELGPSYTQDFSTSEVVQVASEGVDQLEMFFGKYLPQLFYSVLAPLTLFAVVAPINMTCAVVLLVCVPLIPVCIMAVQRIAGRLFKHYWGSYTELGDIFLEDVQGMTTLKINGADEHYQRKMNEAAERFRVITMRVLLMQLNSIIVMDLIAYGGAVVGIIVAASQLASGALGLAGALVIVLLAAEFFIPMRTLGSFFHVAMNGMSASKKIFALLDALTPAPGTARLPEGPLDVVFDGVGFAYGQGAKRAADSQGADDRGAEPARQVLTGLDLVVPAGGFVGLVGLSGCGKSTAVNLLVHRMRAYTGSIRLGGVELRDVDTAELLSRVTLVGNASYLFAGTVADNLRMADPAADERAMRSSLERVRILDFFEAHGGLSARIEERGSNLSGGQRQRLALARALLRDSDVYLFDEATSNIDAESERIIMEVVRELARTHTVLLISHRLSCVRDADAIAYMEGGRVVELGTHEDLVARGGAYARIFSEQHELETYGQTDSEVVA